MKLLYLLTLILVFGNCVTTTSYYPEGIENETGTTVDESKLARPKVNLTARGDWSSIISFAPLSVPDKGSSNYYSAFKYDSNSSIFLEVNRSQDPSGYSTFVVCIFLPCFLSSSVTESIKYGKKNDSTNKKFEITKRVYLPIPWVSMMGYLFSILLFQPDTSVSEKQKFNEIQERFLLSLREEIAKIAPLADPDSDAPQTTDLPTTFNDIVVLKNGDILEGVHTKVTPTTLEVTESNGKKTIYKKSQVLSVKKK